MKRRPSMRSRGCSRTGLRKNRAAAAVLAGALLTAVFLLLPMPAAAQWVDLRVTSRTGSLAVSLTFRAEQPQEVVSLLRKGLESRITFTTRLYEKRNGIIPVLGDRMIAEKRVARSAFWDFLDGRFVVEADNGTQSTYGNAADFLKGFFAFDDLFLSVLPRDARRRLYVTARAQFEPVRLMPPLTLVTLVGGAAISTTPWARTEIP
jgi:hypothetical protein